LNIRNIISFIFETDYSCWNSPCEGCEQLKPNSTNYECTCSKSNSLTCKSEIQQPLGICTSVIYLSDQRLACSFDDYSIKISDNFFQNYLPPLNGHTDQINAMIQLETDILLSGSCDTTIKVWNITSSSMSLMNTLTAHTGCVNTLLKVTINSIDFFLSGSTDSTTILWSNKIEFLANFYNLTDQFKHTDSIQALTFFSYYNYLAIGSKDSTVSLWSMNFFQGQSIGYLFSDHLINSINSLAILPNTSIILAGSSNQEINIWNFETFSYELLATLNSPVLSLTVLPNSMIISGTWENTIEMWNSTTFQLVHTLTGHTGRVSALTFVPSNLNIISSSMDKTIKIWNSTSFELIQTLYGHTGGVSNLVILDDTLLISGSYDLSIRKWNLTSFSQINIITAVSWINSLVILPTNKNLIAAFTNIISIRESNQLDLIIEWTGHSKTINVLAIQPNTNYIISGSEDQTVKVWQSESPYQLIQTLTGHTDHVGSLVILPNGGIVSGGGNKDQSVIIWNVTQTSELNVNFINSLEQTGPVTALASFKQIYLLVGSTDASISIWNIQKLVRYNTYNKVHSQAITCLLNINDLYFASASLDKKIVIWNSDLINTYVLTQHNGRINSLTTNLTYLVSSSADTSVIVWKFAETLTLVKNLVNNSKQINDVIELTNSNYLVSASDDWLDLKVWDLNVTLTGHKNDVYSLIELPDQRMASCSKDKSIIIWNTNNFQPIKYLFGHLGPVISLALIGSQYLASGSCDRTIRIWDLNDYSTKSILKGHLDCINVLIYSEHINFLSISHIEDFSK
jgi:WD40 repeat protein